MITYKIVRFQKIKENGIFRRAVIGVTCSNGEQSAYMDWIADAKELGDSEQDILAHIKKHLTEVTNQEEIDKAPERKASLEKQIASEKDSKSRDALQHELEVLVVPQARTRWQALKEQLEAPVIEKESDQKMIGKVVGLDV